MRVHWLVRKAWPRPWYEQVMGLNRPRPKRGPHRHQVAHICPPCPPPLFSGGRTIPSSGCLGHRGAGALPAGTGAAGPALQPLQQAQTFCLQNPSPWAAKSSGSDTTGSGRSSQAPFPRTSVRARFGERPRNQLHLLAAAENAEHPHRGARELKQETAAFVPAALYGKMPGVITH